MADDAMARQSEAFGWVAMREAAEAKQQRDAALRLRDAASDRAEKAEAERDGYHDAWSEFKPSQWTKVDGIMRRVDGQLADPNELHRLRMIVAMFEVLPSEQFEAARSIAERSYPTPPVEADDAE